MIRCEISFRSGDEIDFKAQLGRLPHLPATYEEDTSLLWDVSKEPSAQTRVTITLIAENMDQLTAIINLIRSGRYEAELTTHRIATQVLTTLSPEPEVQLPKRDMPFDFKKPCVGSGLTEEQWIAKGKANQAEMVERSAERQVLEAEKTEMLRQLEADAKAKRATAHDSGAV